MKNGTILGYSLSMKIKYSSPGIFLSQSKYAHELEKESLMIKLLADYLNQIQSCRKMTDNIYLTLLDIDIYYVILIIYYHTPYISLFPCKLQILGLFSFSRMIKAKVGPQNSKFHSC